MTAATIGPVQAHSLLTNDDLYLFNEGSHFYIYEKLGAHPLTLNGEPGTHFAVWAPNAAEVSVMGDFNEWKAQELKLHATGQSGIWQGFIPGVQKGALYKYHILSHDRQKRIEKADPVAFFAEVPPSTASRVWKPDYAWTDQAWMKNRAEADYSKSPMTVYELHAGSWMRVPEEDNRPLTYREMAEKLIPYVKELGFTHVEFMPLMEHPFDGSWGYQGTGYFASTSRFGTPEDLMYLIDQFHQNGIGVLLDWVPSHFPTDAHGLGYFDGTHLYEHEDPRKGFHPDWGSLIFNYGRHEVRCFLISSAFYWFDKFHIDGLRVDAVASMLYLDYSRKDGEWIPNQFGGKENIDAIDFMKRLNAEAYQAFPGVQMIAEESTSWPMVSRPTYIGGLGFGMKWDMGWMNDTLRYFAEDPVHRKYHHNGLTFRMMYAFTENFILSLSHDEVVHGKGSMLNKMPGDEWQKFANNRLLYGYMYTNPGKKLMFMGGEFGQWSEWNHQRSLDWHLIQFDRHKGLKNWITDCNRVYRSEKALYEKDWDHNGFEWVDFSDWEQSVISFLRKSKTDEETILVACNFTPVVRYNYHVGVPKKGAWKEILNSDAKEYGGSGQGNRGGVQAIASASHGRPYSVPITLPPLAVVVFKHHEKK